MVVWQYMLIVYKNEGETPLEALERARISENIAPDVPMTYAGRLDPMAEGVLIVLVGEECKQKEQYLGLDKVYEFDILVGLSTDTYDMLGLVTSAQSINTNDIEQKIKEALSLFVGLRVQTYPPFSSKTSGGVQLFVLAKQNNLPQEMPSHSITIYSLEVIGSDVISKDELEKSIPARITQVSGDFRQAVIIDKWNEILSVDPRTEFSIIQCRASVSSGTYIRQLVADISTKIGIPLVTYSIKRTKIGEEFF